MAHKGQTVKQSPRSIAPGFPDWLGQLGSRERYPGARPTVPVCAAVGLLVSRHVLLRTAFQVPACPCQSSCGLNHPRPLANHANGSDKSRGGNSFERLCGYCYPHISKNDKLYNGGTFLTKNQAKQNGHGQNANLVAFVHGRLQMALGGAIALYYRCGLFIPLIMCLHGDRISYQTASIKCKTSL